MTTIIVLMAGLTVAKVGYADKTDITEFTAKEMQVKLFWIQ
jgi:hypothetical protein